MHNPSTRELVRFDQHGAFELLPPGLTEIVATDFLTAVAGGNWGCTRIGPRNSNCFNEFCLNNTCVNVAC